MFGQPVGALLRAIHYKKTRNAAIPQLSNHLLADGAGAKNQRTAIVQFSEDAFGQFDAGGSHGHRPCPQLGLRAHALADLERALKQAIQHRSRSALLVRDPISFAHLAKNFGFAEHHGVEPCGDTEQMPYRLAVIVVV